MLCRVVLHLVCCLAKEISSSICSLWLLIYNIIVLLPLVSKSPCSCYTLYVLSNTISNNIITMIVLTFNKLYAFLMQNGLTPLYYACRGRNVKAVHLLVDSGALVNEVQHCYVNNDFFYELL